MGNEILKIKKNYPDAQVPVRAHETDSGLDLFAYGFIKLFTKEGGVLNGNEILQNGYSEEAEDKKKPYIILASGERALIDTGISATVGKGFEIQIRPRSGLALKQGLTVLNTPGTIDEAYRGMLGVILINLSPENQTICVGDRIAQMVVSPVSLCEAVVVDDLDETVRGVGGFGSSGV